MYMNMELGVGDVLCPSHRLFFGDEMEEVVIVKIIDSLVHALAMYMSATSGDDPADRPERIAGFFASQVPLCCHMPQRLLHQLVRGATCPN